MLSWRGAQFARRVWRAAYGARRTARGVTMLLTTHEPDVAAAIVTHLALMCEGQVYQTSLLSPVFTAEHLSVTYNVPASVTQVDGRQIAPWT